MSGVICIIILNGGDAQGAAAQLSANINSSCVLVDYLENDEDLDFDPADAQPIADFHAKALKTLNDLNSEIKRINEALAKKYNRETSYT